jgi:hypothetical protein
MNNTIQGSWRRVHGGRLGLTANTIPISAVLARGPRPACSQRLAEQSGWRSIPIDIVVPQTEAIVIPKSYAHPDD